MKIQDEVFAVKLEIHYVNGNNSFSTAFIGADVPDPRLKLALRLHDMVAYSAAFVLAILKKCITFR